MKLLFKLLHFLWLLSATIGLQLIPPLNIDTPIGLDLEIGGINTNLLQNIHSENKRQILPQQCICYPNNANSQSVINYVNPENEDIERIVVYLYRIDGIVKVYIPNKNKQDLFPEPYLDENEGDILTSITSENIIDLFDFNVIKTQQTVNTISVVEEVVNESETIDVEINKLRPINIDTNADQLTELLIEDVDYSLIPVDDNVPVNDIVVADEQTILIENISQTSNEIQEEVISNVESNVITNVAEVDELYQINSISPPESDEISNSIAAINKQELDSIISELSNSDSVNIVTSILSPPSDNEDNVNKELVDTIPNSDGFDEIQEILSIFPHKQSHHKLPIQQNQLLLNTNVDSYITFHDWFEEQLKHIVLHNLETPAKIKELRERIKKVLQENGMHFSVKGIVTDSNGNLVRLNNIKLRPILIGGQVDIQNFIGHQKKFVEGAVSYVQFIEIIRHTPPKLLGTLVIGTVYLPRSVHAGQKANLWNILQDKNNVQNKKKGCVTCKKKVPQNPYSVVKKLQYPSIPVPYGKYHGLPFRRNFSTGTQPSIVHLPHRIPSVPNAEPQRRVSEDVNKSGLGGIFDGFLDNIVIAPTVVANPNRRLLGGAVPRGPKPGPKPHPSDVLPGFRIIGGNAATSSGTPLVNKGRSGYEKPSVVI